MKRNKKKDKITFLLLLLLGISIGFAALATTLKINGTANISKNTWNVYWDNIDNQDGVTPTTSEIVNEDDAHKKNIVNFEVTFEKPGDYYEFTVDAVNAGTIDAEILSIEKKFDDNVISQENPLPSYLKYEVTYEDGSEIKVEDKLAKRTDASTFTRKTYKIRVEYDRDAVTNSDVNNQVGDVTHTFDFKVEYGQATPSEGGDEDEDISDIIAEIEADPDSHRNPQQDVANEDIALDKHGNVINLDRWIGEDQVSYGYTGKTYSLEYDWDTEERYAIVGNCSGYVSMATASETIVNGEWTEPIPAYIMFEGESEFVPVRETNCLFARTYYESQQRSTITKLPKFPQTITYIGQGTFNGIETFENITIPKQIKNIGTLAFAGAYNPNGANNTLSFETGSVLTTLYQSAFGSDNLKTLSLPDSLVRIEDGVFQNNSLSGNLTLPSGVNYIGYRAFLSNNLTSVTIPSGAEYATSCIEQYSQNSCDSFDDDVTIIQN